MPEGDPDAGRVCLADPGGEHCHGPADVVHRLAQVGCHLTGAVGGERRPHRLDAVLLVLMLRAHGSIVPRIGGPRPAHRGASSGLVRSRAAAPTQRM
ncbi:hypothetical protein JCM12681A_74190 [Streptomyces mexicanus]